MKMLPLTLVVVATTSVTSCATLELVTFGITGISYVATGKSLTDHAISTVMSQDCALYRIIIGQNACIDEEALPNSVMLAQAPVKEPSAKRTQMAALLREPNSNRDELNPVVTNLKIPVISPPTSVHSKLIYTDSNATSVLASQLRGHSNKAMHAQPNKQEINKQELINDVTWLDRIVSVQATPKLFAVLGSFNQLEFANERMAIHSEYDPKLVTVTKSDHSVQYRVVVGPLNEESYQQYVAQTGQLDAWRVMLCQDNYSLPPCNPPMLVNNASE